MSKPAESIENKLFRNRLGFFFIGWSCHQLLVTILREVFK